jgi:hypothetical protein
MPQGIVLLGLPSCGATRHHGEPTWLAYPRSRKNKFRLQIKNMFINNRGFPDQSDKFDILLHNIDGGPVLQKLNSLTPKSIPAGTKLVLFGRYVLNIYVGIVQYFLRTTKLSAPKSTYRHNPQIGEYCRILTSAKKIRF